MEINEMSWKVNETYPILPCDDPSIYVSSPWESRNSCTFPHGFPVYPNYNLFGPSLHDNMHHLLIICHPFMGIMDCCPSPITVTLPGSNKTSNTKDLIGWLSKNIRLCHSQNHVTKLCNDIIPEKWISPKARRIRFRWWPGTHTRYSLIYLAHMSIWVFPKIGVPPNHQF